MFNLGPVPAITAVLNMTGLKLQDIDLFEINVRPARASCSRSHWPIGIS